MRNSFTRRLLSVILSVLLTASLAVQVTAETSDEELMTAEPVTSEDVLEEEELPEEEPDSEEIVPEDAETEASEDSEAAEIEAPEEEEVPLAMENPEYAALKPMAKSNVSISMVADGLMLSYKPAKNSAGTAPAGYMILHKVDDGKWNVIKSSSKVFTTKFQYYKQRSLKQGMHYYAVVPYYNTDYIGDVITPGYYSIDSSIADACAVKYYWMDRVGAVTTVRSGTTLTGGWAKVSGATGYQFQYARNPIFVGAKSVDVSGGSKQSVTVKDVKRVKFYGRVRAYRVVNGIKYYSDWGLSMGSNYEVKATLNRVKFNKKTYNLYIASGQKTNTSGYSVMQGGCTDGTYMYFVMENQKNSRCKIAKVRRSDGKVVKVSTSKNIGHGNGMTYNSKKKELIVIHNKPNKMRITRINPSTLKIIASRDVKPPKTLFADGVHRSSVDTKLSGTDGYISATYISGKDQYAFLTRGTSSEIMITDSDFKPLYMITLSKKKAANYYYQDVYATSSYILVAQSGNINLKRTFKYCDDPVFVYDYSGKYLGRLTVSSRYELENVSVAGGKLYYGFHTSWDYPKFKRRGYLFTEY